jgi:regulator of protease activity HflC (stomatin/prohibitin superfamily)
VILKAQGDKQSAILKAEGESKAIELVAASQAAAIKLVSEAANQYFMENAQLNKRLDVIRDTFSQQTKIVVPSSADILNVLGLEGTSVLPIKTKKTETEKSEQQGAMK